MTQESGHTVVGCLEKVSLPLLGVKNVWAKVDTGAYSGALHCTDIRLVRKSKNAERTLRFTPLGKPKLATETTHFVVRYVRSSNGTRVKRYIIDTEIVIDGQTYTASIGLSDRTRLQRPVLLGRRFLRLNNILVDVTINQDHDYEKGL